MNAALKLSDTRHAPRMPLRLQVEYRSLDEFLVDYTSNVSLGGIFIQTAEPLPVGTRFRLRLRIPGRKRAIETVGTVRWAMSVADAGPMNPGMGVQFDPLYPADVRAIERMLSAWEQGAMVPVA